MYRCLQPGRSRLDVELVVDIVRELQPDAEDAPRRWRQAHQVITGLAAEASVVDVRAELPPDEPAFVGRSPAVAAMLAELAGSGPRIIAIDGMPGVGKSTLAVRVAHLAGDLEAFTVDLRGFATDRPPADPAAVLDGLLRRLAPAGSRAPHTTEDKIERFRELAARRPIVLLLDNAASAEQVRPLLAMTDGSVVLVTGRHRLVLPGLAITLDVLDPAESVELLSRSTGETGPELAQLADLAGHLPLALTLLAGHIRDHPDWTLADHVDRLRERRTMLRLDGGIELALRAAYERLTPPHRALLRALSLSRGVDVDVYTAAALAGCDVPTAGSLLGGLHRVNLLRQPRPGRYQLHDAMRVFAGARAIDEDSARGRASRLCCPRPSRATWPCMRTSRTPRPCTWPPSGAPKAPRWDVRCSASARCTGAAVSSSRPRSATARHWPKVTTRPSSAGRTRTSA